jgi:hypothetical protein
MTTAKFRRVTWQWANPLWWAERQLEAAACAMRMTEVVVDASLSSVLGGAGRTVSGPAASAPAARPACVPVPAAETVTAPVAAPVPSVVPVPVPAPPWEAGEPHRELAAVDPKPELEAVKRGPQLTSVKPEAELEPVEPEAALGAVTPGPKLESVKLEAEPEAPAGGPKLGAVPAAGTNGSERAPAGDPPVPGWDELTLGSIRARLRRLSEDDLVALHGYEERHAAREDVLSMLHNRLTKVRSAVQAS